MHFFPSRNHGGCKPLHLTVENRARELSGYWFTNHSFNFSCVHCVLFKWSLVFPSEDPNQFKTGHKECRSPRIWLMTTVVSEFRKLEVCWFGEFFIFWWGERDIEVGQKWYRRSSEGGARESQQPRHAYLSELREKNQREVERMRRLWQWQRRQEDRAGGRQTQPIGEKKSVTWYAGQHSRCSACTAAVAVCCLYLMHNSLSVSAQGFFY